MHTRKTLEPCKTARRASPRPRARAPGPAMLTAAASLTFAAVSPASAEPTGGVVVQGQGSISTPSTGNTVIDQSSQQLQLNWSSFNVGATESVQFNQPSAKTIAINRILDQNPSQIFGRIDANGQVVLVNPNGVLIGRTAQLNTGSLVVSSLDAVDFDSANGRYRFSTSRADPGAVINDGSINAAPGGSVTLLGGRVSNTGSIVADFGAVNLAAGRAATIDLAGDGLLRLEVDANLIDNSDGAASAVENSGSVQANGGQVLLTASAVRGVFANLVNNTGVVRANRIDNSGGVIRLSGPDGTVFSSGTLDASADDAQSTGGSVSILGDRVGVLGNAVIDVSGSTGGGTALIGGDYQGANPNVRNASRTAVSSGATIDADAGTTGNGGRIIVWSNDATRYAGSLSARGGELSGNAGFAEVSGKHWLDFTGTAALDAPHGAWGTLLLDPANITIDTSGDVGPVPADDGLYFEGEDFGQTVTIGSLRIENLLRNVGSVILEASNDITQLAGAGIDVLGSGGAFGRSLTLNAGHSITLNDAIRTNNGAVTMTADTGDIRMLGSAYIAAGAGAVALTAGGDLAVTSIGTGGTATLTANRIMGDASVNTRINADEVFFDATIGITLDGGYYVGTNANFLSAKTVSGVIRIEEANDVTVKSLINPSAALTQVLIGGPGVLTIRDTNVGGALYLSGTSIVDDGFSHLAANGVIYLSALQSIGTIQDFNALQGTPINIASAAGVDVRITSPAADLNLLLATAFTNLFPTSSVRLGSGIGFAGRVILQTNNLFDVGAVLQPGALQFGGSNTARVALSSNNGLLLVPSVPFNLTDQGTDTLLLHGRDIIDTDGTPTRLTLTGNKLIFRADAPSGDVTLDTSVGQLDATVGNARNLIVNEADSLVLGAISATGANVTITAANSVDDDGLATVVAGNVVKITGESIGSFGNEVDTRATSLDLTATGPYDLYLREDDDVDLKVSASSLVDVRTLEGKLDVTSVTGADLTLVAGGTTPHDLTINGTVTSTGGAVSLVTPNSGGDVILNAPIVATSAITYITAGGGPNGAIIAGFGNSIATNSLVIRGTSVGSSAQRLNTSADVITVTAYDGDAYIQEADAVDLHADVTDGDLNVRTTSGAITVSALSANQDVTLEAGGGAGIILNSNIDAGTGAVALTAGGAISVNPGSTITADQVSLVAGSVGTVNARLETHTNSLDATTTNGGLFVSEADGLDLVASATGGAVDVQTLNGSITAGAVEGDGVALVAGGASSSISLTDVIDGRTGDVSLTSSGALSSTGGGGILADGLTISASSIGTTGATLFTSVSSVDATATNGGIKFLNGSSSALDATFSATGGAIEVGTFGSMNVHAATGAGIGLGATGSLTVSGPLAAGSGNVVFNSGDALTLNGAVVTTGDISITAGAPNVGNTLIAGTGNQLTASNLTITAAQIGSAGARLNTTVGSLDATAYSGGIFVTESDALSLNAVATGGAVNVRAMNGALTVASAVGDGVTLATGGDGNSLTVNGGAYGGVLGNAGDVLMTTSGAGSDIVLNQGVSTTGTIIFAANGDGSNVALNALVSTTADVHVNAGSAAQGGAITGGQAGIEADSADLTAGSIGAKGAKVATNVRFLNASTTNGGINVMDANDLTMVAHATNGELDIGSFGSLNVIGASGKGVTLAANGGNLLLNGDVDAQGGAAFLAAIGALDTVGPATISADFLYAIGASIGTAGQRLNTRVTTLNSFAQGGGTFINEVDDVTVGSIGIGAPIDLRTVDGSIEVTAVSGDGVSLMAGGAGNGITLNGPIEAGGGDVNLTAGIAGARGAIDGPAASVHGAKFIATAASIGTSAAPLILAVDDVTADASAGDIYLLAPADLRLANVNASGNVNASSFQGGIQVGAVSAANSVSLTATEGAITDDGDGSTRISAPFITLSARSIGEASLQQGGTLDSSRRLDIQASTLDATATAGGIFIDELDGLLSASAQAEGGADGDIELLTASGDLNLLQASASDSLLLAAGGNIFALPGLGKIVARAAELRVGGAGGSAGHIGTSDRPLDFQLSAGNTLRLVVPQSVDATSTTSAPMVKPVAGVQTTLARFQAPSTQSVKAGFGQLTVTDEVPFTSPGIPTTPPAPPAPPPSGVAISSAAVNQPANARAVREDEPSPPNPDARLFETRDPAVCLPPDQRKKDAGDC